MSLTRRPGKPSGSSSRRSPGRPAVARDRIVTTALRIIHEDGADGLSMRSLAERLSSGTATLYRHYPSRANLIADVVDHVFGTVALDADALSEMSWQDALRATTHAMFATIRRHRNIAPLLVMHVPMGANAMAYRERCLAILNDNGFAPTVAVRAYATLARYTLGFASQPVSAKRSRDDAQAAAVLRGADRSAFPATFRGAAAFPVPLQDEFAFGLELLLAGLGQLRRAGRLRSR